MRTKCHSCTRIIPRCGNFGPCSDGRLELKESDSSWYRVLVCYGTLDIPSYMGTNKHLRYRDVWDSLAVWHGTVFVDRSAGTEQSINTHQQYGTGINFEAAVSNWREMRG